MRTHCYTCKHTWGLDIRSIEQGSSICSRAGKYYCWITWTLSTFFHLAKDFEIKLWCYPTKLNIVCSWNWWKERNQIKAKPVFARRLGSMRGYTCTLLQRKWEYISVLPDLNLFGNYSNDYLCKEQFFQELQKGKVKDEMQRMY